ncbi:Tbcc [Symbiodinium natans]|uniref:Tbcc protein n=1 Tax=Symbiodinium natans TaxID=878477 RepID=A0A812IKK1_9DINO|nr:Tbcc [Symbiodinium natans]
MASLPAHERTRQKKQQAQPSHQVAATALAAEIAAKREQLAPRKKFSFKRRTPAPGSAPAGYSEAGTTGKPAETASGAAGEDAFLGERIAELRGERILRKPGDLEGRDVSLRDLEDCRIVLLDRVGALHVQQLTRCEVVVGAVSSSALIHFCKDCVFTLAVKQLRLHDSEKVALHLHTLSGPIIETSKRIAFAPLDLNWDTGADLLTAASLGSSSGEDGVWSEVQDFNWLKRQASPNWRVVPPGRRRAPLSLSTAEEVLQHYSQLPLPPALPEVAQYESCWESSAAAGADDEF